MVILARGEHRRRGNILFPHVPKLWSAGETDDEICPLFLVQTGHDHWMNRGLLLDRCYPRDLVSSSVHEPYCEAGKRACMRKDPEIGALSDSDESECPEWLDGVLVENGCALAYDGDVESLGET